MSDDLVKRLRTPVGFQDLPFIQEEAADRIAALEAQRDEAVKALMDLERCSTRVKENRPRRFGDEWMKLSRAIGAARFVLEKMPTPDEPKCATIAELTGDPDA